MQGIVNSLKMDGATGLLTGASGKLGSAIAEALAQLGVNLYLLDKNSDALDKLSSALTMKYGVECVCLLADLGHREECCDLINSVVSNRGNTLDILINNAAYVGASKLDGWNVEFMEQTVPTWTQAIDVNLTAPFWLSQLCVPYLANSPAASIINIASIYGSCAPRFSLYDGLEMNNPAAYAASKAGLIQLTKWLASELGPAIRVNAVSPGGIERNQPSEFVDRYCSLTPLNRMASEMDVAGVVVFLASQLSSYITGQNIFVDGGWSIF